MTPHVRTVRAPDAAVVRRPARVRVRWLVVLVVVLAALMAASVVFGSRGVTWSDVWT